MSVVRCDSVQGPLPRLRYTLQPESSDHPAASLVAREHQLSCHAPFCANAGSLQSAHRRKTHSLPETPVTPEDDESTQNLECHQATSESHLSSRLSFLSPVLRLDQSTTSHFTKPLRQRLLSANGQTNGQQEQEEARVN
ncbi:hypothetical protein SRHO_G00126730 [Serrasalmus rhombeus]